MYLTVQRNHAIEWGGDRSVCRLHPRATVSFALVHRHTTMYCKNARVSHCPRLHFTYSLARVITQMNRDYAHHPRAHFEELFI